MLECVTHAESERYPDPNRPRQGTVTPDFIQTSSPDSDDPATEIRAGIAAASAQIAPWYLYDQVGSRLFDVITQLPDYYPTRTERAILAEHLPAMAKATPLLGCTLIDLGAGSCEKAPLLFPHIRPKQYVPVDISVDYLRETVTQLQGEHQGIEMIGVGTDFSNNLVLPDSVGKEPRLFFYPGSSIGNFTPSAAKSFLKQVRAQMPADGALWIGIDLVKDKQTLERAYDDELGVTAAFNRNMLRNVNRIAQTDFNPALWDHVARFDEQKTRIEMHLEATMPITVSWPGGEREFDCGERIHTESSYKYTPDSFELLLVSAGLQSVGMWTDPKQWFAFFAAIPTKLP